MTEKERKLLLATARLASILGADPKLSGGLIGELLGTLGEVLAGINAVEFEVTELRLKAARENAPRQP